MCSAALLSVVLSPWPQNAHTLPLRHPHIRLSLAGHAMTAHPKELTPFRTRSFARVARVALNLAP